TPNYRNLFYLFQAPKKLITCRSQPHTPDSTDSPRFLRASAIYMLGAWKNQAQAPAQVLSVGIWLVAIKIPPIGQVTEEQ
ncbi:MAG: hypothetical protein AAB941_02560, partial [Patescibacteria group bacterium]